MVKQEHALPVKKLWQPLCIRGFPQFFAVFVLFCKTVVNTHKTVDKKAPEQIFAVF